MHTPMFPARGHTVYAPLPPVAAGFTRGIPEVDCNPA